MNIRDFVHWLFSEKNSDLTIGLFDVWHFLYLFIIFGGTVLLALLVRKRSESARDRVLRIMAYLTVGLYVADFLIMPLSDSYSGISVYKLPFNICTIMAVLVPFVQFNRHFRPIKSVVVTLSIASSLMWMCYPGSALGGQPPVFLHYLSDLHVPRLFVLLGRLESGIRGDKIDLPYHLEGALRDPAHSRLGGVRQRDL